MYVSQKLSKTEKEKKKCVVTGGDFIVLWKLLLLPLLASIYTYMVWLEFMIPLGPTHGPLSDNKSSFSDSPFTHFTSQSPTHIHTKHTHTHREADTDTHTETNLIAQLLLIFHQNIKCFFFSFVTKYYCSIYGSLYYTKIKSLRNDFIILLLRYDLICIF